MTKSTYKVGGDRERAAYILRVIGALSIAGDPVAFSLHFEEQEAEAYRLLGHEGANKALREGIERYRAGRPLDDHAGTIRMSAGGPG